MQIDLKHMVFRHPFTAPMRKWASVRLGNPFLLTRRAHYIPIPSGVNSLLHRLVSLGYNMLMKAKNIKDGDHATDRVHPGTQSLKGALASKKGSGMTFTQVRTAAKRAASRREAEEGR